VDSSYNYNVIPSKYCPKENIIITKSSNIINLNNGLLCYKLSTETFSDVVNLIVPNNVSLEITTDGKITIYDCEFITNKTQNIYLNNYNISYNLSEINNFIPI
jgi:hypothetical protein